jgi:hypothetical protein
LQFSILLARERRANRESRVVFIAWSDHIDREIALECDPGKEGDLVGNARPVRRSTQFEESRMTIDTSRRTALVGFGALAMGSAALAAGPSRAATNERIIPPGARELSELMERLRRASRRRDFKTVPMILQNRDLWDDEALSAAVSSRAAKTPYRTSFAPETNASKRNEPDRFRMKTRKINKPDLCPTAHNGLIAGSRTEMAAKNHVAAPVCAPGSSLRFSTAQHGYRLNRPAFASYTR